MLSDVVDDPGTASIDDLLRAHAARLAAVIKAVGPDTVTDATGIAPETVSALVEAEADAAGSLEIELVAAILTCQDGDRSAPDIVSDARDDLLFGMTAGVLNVDRIAAAVALDLEPREVQGMLEGRHPMTLREYVAIQQAIEGRTV